MSSFSHPIQRSWCHGVLAGGLVLASVLPAAQAAPDAYQFSTGSLPYGTGPVGAFNASTSVSGLFSYDAALAATGTASNGATLYNGSYAGLSGSVQGWSFSDPGGYTAVGNNLVAQGNNDYLQVGADPGLGNGTHNISGFEVAGYTLVNVRIFWIQGQLGIGDFLNSAALPNPLPAFAGRLALDFVPTATPSGPLSFVFFDGATVSAVPEPSQAALCLAGLAGLARAACRPLGGWAAALRLTRFQSAGAPSVTGTLPSATVIGPLPL